MDEEQVRYKVTKITMVIDMYMSFRSPDLSEKLAILDELTVYIDNYRSETLRLMEERHGRPDIPSA